MFKGLKITVCGLSVLVSLVVAAHSAAAETIEGIVDFETRLLVRPLTSGTVTKLHANVGDQVAAGTLLIEIDSARQAAKVKIATNKVAKMRIAADELAAAFARQEELFDQGSLSLLLYEEAQNKLKLAELDLASARARLSRANSKLALTRLSSPMDATVITVSAHAGMNVHPEFQLAPLMTLGSTGQYIAQFSVPLATWIRLSEMGSVEVSAGGQTYQASVALSSLDPLPFTDGSAYTVDLKFSDSNRLLLPGTAASINLE